MSETERELLRLILSEWNRVKNLSGVRDLAASVTERLAHSSAIQDLRTGLGVRVRGDWLGRDAAARQARRRGLVALERQGFIELRSGWGRNITHALPTGAGIGLADELGVALVMRSSPPTPPLRPQIEHRPTMVEQRRAAAEAWSLECKAKAAKREAEHEVDSDADKVAT